ncbi:MAG: polyphosphate kinase 1 [Bacteroidota bacterium]|nr:polyphosphate kinase 1 [Bacteroidota bacterium]
MNKNSYRNKEISWLAFNARVLQEAANPDVPLVERMKFLGIYSNNLDEFFRVRVATLKRLSQFGKSLKSMFDEEPEIIIQKINYIIVDLQKKFAETYNQVVKEFEKKDVFIINEKELQKYHREFVHEYFVSKIRPKLFPVIITKNTSTGHLRNDAIYLAVDLESKTDPGKDKVALVKVPSDELSRFLHLPSENNQEYIILLDDVIRFGLPEIFEVLNYNVKGAYTIKLTRDAELDIDDDLGQSYVEKISKSIARRKSGAPVRFVYDRNIPLELLKTVSKLLNLSKSDTPIAGGRYHNFKDFMKFPDVGKPNLKFEHWPAIRHKDLVEHKSILAVMAKKDVLLHFPYQPFIHVIDLLREAALDPKVTTIKITIYRVAFNSSIMNALINASRNGKQVTAILELQARFNEESNIYWSKKLVDAGVKVIYGVPGLKVHSKTILIRRKEDKKIVRYVALGTGNFNEDTAKVFSDVLLLTSRQDIAYEVDRVFDFFSRNYSIPRFQHLLVSPFNNRTKFVKLINNEIRAAKEGKKAAMIFKLNNLADHRIINIIYGAHKAGVDIKLMVRGMFSLFPEIKSRKINIECIGIIDRYLEHSRIYYFYNGGEEKLFISSADLMGRNLDRRVEITCPIYDPEIKKQIIHNLNLEWQDNTQARVLDNDLNNRYRTTGEENKSQAQKEIYEYIKSIHK